MVAIDSRKALVGEIFHLTGQKVEIDDPVVVAALINSQLIRQAGEDAMFSIQSALNLAMDDLSESVKEERAAAAEICNAIALADQRISLITTAAEQAEVIKMRAQFSDVVVDMLEQIRKEAGQTASYGWKIKFCLLALTAMVWCGALGVVAGAAWFGKAKPMIIEQVQQ
jgi:hypothetical protein